MVWLQALTPRRRPWAILSHIHEVQLAWDPWRDLFFSLDRCSPQHSAEVASTSGAPTLGQFNSSQIWEWGVAGHGGKRRRPSFPCSCDCRSPCPFTSCPLFMSLSLLGYRTYLLFLGRGVQLLLDRKWICPEIGNAGVGVGLGVGDCSTGSLPETIHTSALQLPERSWTRGLAPPHLCPSTHELGTFPP